MSPIESNGIFLKTLGLITWLLETTPMVWPSGAALTSTEVPVTPPAPARFSITTGWPSAFDNAGLAARMFVSTPDPGLTGRMTRIGVCACALNENAAAAHKTAARRSDETRMVSPDRNPLCGCTLMWQVVLPAEQELLAYVHHTRQRLTHGRTAPAHQ